MTHGADWPDVALAWPELVVYLSAFISVLVVFGIWAWFRSRPALIVNQPVPHCPGCVCGVEPTQPAKVRRALKGGVLILGAVMLTGCAKSNPCEPKLTRELNVNPRVALISTRPVWVVVTTGLLPEGLWCARAVWDWDDGSISGTDSEVCQERRSAQHRYISAGRHQITLTLVPSIGPKAVYRGFADLVPPGGTLGMEREF